jgi:magnesium chelatase subunit I
MTLGDDDASEDKLVATLVGEAVKKVFNQTAEMDEYESVIEQFGKNVTFPGGDEISADEFVANMNLIKGLPKFAAAIAKELGIDPTDNGHLASAGEFLLEGLYVNNRLSKFSRNGKNFFRK